MDGGVQEASGDWHALEPARSNIFPISPFTTKAFQTTLNSENRFLIFEQLAACGSRLAARAGVWGLLKVAPAPPLLSCYNLFYWK